MFRLCVRNLRLFGRAEVDLMRQGEPQVRLAFSFQSKSNLVVKVTRQPAEGRAREGQGRVQLGFSAGTA